MKTYLAIIILVISFNWNIQAQNIIDDNTTSIENYFFNEQNDNLQNNAQSNFNSESIVTIYQSGDYNNVEILSSGNKVQLVKQVGDNNNYQYYNFYDSSKANLEINQFGDENDIQIYGHNSIIENLKISQTTNNQNILIINF